MCIATPKDEWGITCSFVQDCPDLHDIFKSPPLSLISWLRMPSPQSLSADEFTIYRHKTTNGTMSKFCLQPSSYFYICFHPFLLFCRWNCCLISYLETIIRLAIIPFSQCLQIVCTCDLFWCSCLENPRDRGAWWAAIYGVAQSRTRLKWLSSSMIYSIIIFFFQNVPILKEPPSAFNSSYPSSFYFTVYFLMTNFLKIVCYFCTQ